MSGIKLRVQIEKNGTLVDVGGILGTSSADAVFSYDDDYVSEKDSRACMRKWQGR